MDSMNRGIPAFAACEAEKTCFQKSYSLKNDEEKSTENKVNVVPNSFG